MANYSQLIVVSGVFFAAILLHVLAVKESSATKTIISTPVANKMTHTEVMKPSQSDDPNYWRNKESNYSEGYYGNQNQPTKQVTIETFASKRPARAAKPQAKPAPAPAPAPAQPAASGNQVTGVPATVANPAQGSKFSELIQSLIAYTPMSGGAPYGTSLGAPAAAQTAGMAGAGIAAAGGAELVSEIKKAVREEVKGSAKSGGATRDDVNNTLSARSNQPVVPSTPKVASPGLNQGTWFRGAQSPYGAGQAMPPVNVMVYPIEPPAAA